MIITIITTIIIDVAVNLIFTKLEDRKDKGRKAIRSIVISV